MPKTTKTGSPEPVAAQSKTRTKIATVVEMLKRADGATLAELVTATGWQAHTVRAALTGLRKKGRAIDKRDRDGVTCYFTAVDA